MITLRPSAERGLADHGWLTARHSFSFAAYRDPRYMGFGPLRVLNQDIISGGGGFATHPHDNMEIITWVLRGALQHQDSMGNGSIIRPGQAQYMSAGTGVRHSEFNASTTEDCELLQMWILPGHRDNTPRYEERDFGDEHLQGRLQLIASGSAADDAITIDQDVRLHAGRFDGEERARLPLESGRRAWVHLPHGKLNLNGVAMADGDGAAVTDTPILEIAGASQAELLVFDLPGD